MDVAVKAIEATGTIDAQHRLFLDEPLPVPCPTRVRVIIQDIILLSPLEVTCNTSASFVKSVPVYPPSVSCFS